MKKIILTAFMILFCTGAIADDSEILKTLKSIEKELKIQNGTSSNGDCIPGKDGAVVCDRKGKYDYFMFAYHRCMKRVESRTYTSIWHNGVNLSLRSADERYCEHYQEMAKIYK